MGERYQGSAPATRPPSLKQADFRSLWLAGLISDGGDWLLFIALPILVYTETGSALGTSVAFLIELAPGILLAPVAGWLADRSDRRRLLLVLTLLQAVSVLPLAIVHGRGGLPIIYGVILVQASLAALFDPAKNALLPTLLPVGELVSANVAARWMTNPGRGTGSPWQRACAWPAVRASVSPSRRIACVEALRNRRHSPTAQPPDQ